MIFRLPLAAAVLAAAPAWAASPPGASQPGAPQPGASPQAAPRELTVASPGGLVGDAQHTLLVNTYTEAAAQPVRQETWEGGLDALRARKDPAAAGAYDVILLRGDELLAACDEGLLEKLDWSAIGGKDHYLPGGASDCGVGAVITGVVLAWDREKLQASPTWSDFWDITKFPGKRGLQKTVRGNLEFALLADGVAPGDVYRTLRSSDGVDRAFRKLDQLRPYIVWWDSPEEAARILGSGEVLMTSAPNGRIGSADRDQHRNFGVQWTGALYEVQSWAVAKGSPLTRQALDFLYFAGTPSLQARIAAQTFYGGLAKGSQVGLATEAAPFSSANPANLSAGLAIDEGFWRDNLDKLSQRFAAWLTH